jgi:nitrogen fixation protein FixH
MGRWKNSQSENRSQDSRNSTGTCPVQRHDHWSVCFETVAKDLLAAEKALQQGTWDLHQTRGGDIFLMCGWHAIKTHYVNG